MKRRGSLRLQTFAFALTLGLLGASCTAVLGIDKDYREGSGFTGGAGGSAGGAQGGGGPAASSSAGSGGGSASNSASQSSSGAGGGPLAVWRSWDAQSSGNPLKLSVLDTNGNHEATIVPYQSKGLMDPSVDVSLSFFTPGSHPQLFNNLTAFWTPQIMGLYPYVGKSSIPRGMDVAEVNAPLPLGVFDLQLYPPSDTTKLVVAAFMAPLAGDYTISELAARRVSSNGDQAALRIFVGSKPAGPMTLVAAKDRLWVGDATTYPLGQLASGETIAFGIDSVGGDNHDATEITWTITAQ